jgi:hypothetical protein
MIQLEARVSIGSSFFPDNRARGEVSVTIGMLLRLLFSLLFILVIGLLLQTIWGDLQQRAEGAKIVRHARAARVIFAALQNLRTERGPILSAVQDADAATVMARADESGRTKREKIVRANPFIEGFTIADLRNWADRKMRFSGL